jgi:competence protein ComEC
VRVSPDGTSFAIRTAGGQFAMLRTGSDTFAIGQWLAADADVRTAKDARLSEGIACDDAGCIGRLADGTVVAIAKTLEAFAEDCVRAALVLSAHVAPPGCRAPVVDRAEWLQNGAIALRRVGNGWVTETARPPGYDRPWARARASTENAGASADGRANTPSATSPSTRPPRDATPRSEDLEPGD